MTSSTFVVPPFDYSISINVAGFKYAKRTPNYTVRGSVVNIVKCRVYKAFLFNLQCSRYNEATGLTIYDSRDLRHAFVVKDE